MKIYSNVSLENPYEAAATGAFLNRRDFILATCNKQKRSDRDEAAPPGGEKNKKRIKFEQKIKPSPSLHSSNLFNSLLWPSH